MSQLPMGHQLQVLDQINQTIQQGQEACSLLAIIKSASFPPTSPTGEITYNRIIDIQQDSWISRFIRTRE